MLCRSNWTYQFEHCHNFLAILNPFSRLVYSSKCVTFKHLDFRIFLLLTKSFMKHYAVYGNIRIIHMVFFSIGSVFILNKILKCVCVCLCAYLLQFLGMKSAGFFPKKGIRLNVHWIDFEFSPWTCIQFEFRNKKKNMIFYRHTLVQKRDFCRTYWKMNGSITVS